MARLHAGDPAPDATVYSPDGNLVRLSRVWATAPAAILFPRHFG